MAWREPSCKRHPGSSPGWLTLQSGQEADALGVFEADGPRIEADGPHVAFTGQAIRSAVDRRRCFLLLRARSGELFGARAKVGEVVLVAQGEAGVEMTGSS